MGKLNYVNRKIGGIKLGQVVAKDLLKRLSQGTTRKAALRDPCVDLDISAKELDDDAVLEIANAFATVMESNRSDATVIKLEEMCLAGNLITAKSLVPLARVVRLAALDLRDLDLSGNQLRINTKEDAQAWECFLSAFSVSRALRRLDLGGNELGEKAFEILAKVYARESTRRSSTNDDPVSGIGARLGTLRLAAASEAGSDEDASERPRSIGISAPRQDANHDPHFLAERENQESGQNGALNNELRDTRLLDRVPVSPLDPEPPSAHESPHAGDSRLANAGIRLIPYLIFDDTRMTDFCALHLSYVVAEHELPGQLLKHVPAAKAGPPAQRLCEYDQDDRCRGIMYRENQQLGHVGQRVLEFAERARDKNPVIRGQRSVSLSAVRDLGTDHDGADRSLHLNRTPNRRRMSSLSVESQEASPLSRILDFGSLKSKLQGESLRRGVAGNDLWFATIRMLNLSRLMLVQVPKSTNGTADLELANRRQALVSRLQATSRTRLPLATARAEGAGEGAELARLTAETLERVNRPYRSDLPYGFSEHIWAKILSQASEADELLTGRQQQAVVRWARSRATLAQEMGELGKPKPNQIWRVLEGMGCLTYEPW